MNDNPAIAILYVCIGRYSILWNDFYLSAEEFLFPGYKKTYFVFSDDEILLNSEIENVHFIKQDNLGWPGNVLYRYHFFKKIEKKLENMDFIFFFNGNYIFVKPIEIEELLPNENGDYWTTLVWHINEQKTDINNFTYERNPESKAFVPFGEGKRYFQSGFYASNSENFWDLVHTCSRWTDEDLVKGIVTIWHDESYFNKYMLNKNPKILSTEYGKPEQWKYPLDAKAILRNKKTIFGKRYLKRLKNGNNKKPWSFFRFLFRFSVILLFFPKFLQ